MPRFSTVLVAGTKAPYTSWTFLDVPAGVKVSPGPVKGTINGVAFRGTLTRSGGTLRMPVTRALQSAVGVTRGARVTVVLDVDPEPRGVNVPRELRDVLGADRELARQFEAMAPSHRRAWAAYVGDAKRPETRRGRAVKAIEGIRARVFPR